MSQSCFTKNGVTVTFSKPHVIPYQVTIRLCQPHDFSLGGVFYLYDRGILIREHRVIFTREPAATVSSLNAFFDTTVRGGKTPFLWIDSLSGEYTVFLTSDITVTEPMAGRFTLAMTLAEIIVPSAEGLLDSAGEPLTDSAGNILMGV